MADSFPYTVTDPAGEVVLQAAEGCRYSRRVELSLLEGGVFHPPPRKENHEDRDPKGAE